METVFAWKPGVRAPVPAEVAGRELERIRAEQAGFFTPAAVVLASRPDDAPLHPAFEWDDGKAAGQYREEQAKYLIRHVVVVREGANADPVRAYVSVSTEGEAHTYTSTERAMAEPDLREQVLAAALRDMHAFERKYSQYAELATVIKAMRRVTMQRGARVGQEPRTAA